VGHAPQVFYPQALQLVETRGSCYTPETGLPGLLPEALRQPAGMLVNSATSPCSLAKVATTRRTPCAGGTSNSKHTSTVCPTAYDILLTFYALGIEGASQEAC
jgi:hypothetical protein